MRAPVVLAVAMLFFAVQSAAQPPRQLTIQQAVDLAVKNYVTVKLAQAENQQARGKVLQDTAALLPQLSASVSQSRVFRDNLAARGFATIQPQLIGPFNVFDARLHLAQTVFDWSEWKKRGSSVEQARAIELEQQLVVEQVSALAALSYIEANRAQNAILAAQAGQQLAERLLRLAQDRRQAGSATLLEVVRAKTRVAEEKLRVIDAQTTSQEALLGLQHLVGIPLAQAIELKEPPDSLGGGMPSQEEEAVKMALANRLELRVAAAQMASAEEGVRAAQAEYFPSLVANGQIAFSGNTPAQNDHLVGEIGLGLSVPVFEGRRIEGKMLAAKGERDKVAARYADLRTQVEQDVRLSLRKLADASQRMETTTLAEKLAQNELDLAQERFRAGLGDNVEVVDAQTRLARNQDSRVAARALYQAVQINLLQALGRMKDTRF